MKKRVLNAAIALMLLPFAGCSSEDENTQNYPPPVAETPDVVTVDNVRSYMSDPNATDETVALFYNLRNLSKTKYLVGQQDAFNAFYNNAGSESDIKKATGSDPGMLGSDFMFITDDNNNGQPNNWFFQQEQIITADAEEAYNKGMVNIFCWHLREPYEGTTFYTEDMTDFQKQNAFASILPGGENHEYYKAKLDKIAAVVKEIKGANGELVPIIFRPFHEFDGNWFWWGAAYSTPEQYKEAYRFTVEYLRDTKQVHNLLYAFSPDNSYSTEAQYLGRYPGDDYVDVLGMDNYGDFANGSAAGTSTASNKLKMVSDIAKAKVKIAALTETGFQVTSSNSPVNGFFSNHVYNAMTNGDVQLAFVMFWANTQNAYYVPPAGQPNTQDFVDFANKAESVLQDNIPEMYVLPND